MVASPCRSALRLALDLPAAVRGPRLFRPLLRLAAIRRCEIDLTAILRRKRMWPALLLCEIVLVASLLSETIATAGELGLSSAATGSACAAGTANSAAM